MKKSVFILTAALSFGMAAAQQAPTAPVAAQVPTLTDVPAGHWAKDAIDRLVARGVLLGYPDGTFRGTQNLTRYEAAVIIARLLNQIGNGQGAGLDAETTTSLQNAVQELSADLAALGVRVNDLEENAVSKEDFTRLEERVEALDGSSDLKGAASRFDELSANYDTLRADVDDNASSIAALNDLTVLLNQDILNLQDRASALEAAQADFVTRTDFDALTTSVKSIDGRVATLENAPKFTISGSLEGRYGSVALTEAGAGDFDIDRLNRSTFINDYFSNDTYCPVAFAGTNGLVLERGNSGVRCVDTTDDLNKITATVSFGVTNLKTLNGKVNVDSAHVALTADHTTDPAVFLNGNGTSLASDTYVALSHADVNGSTTDGIKFSIAFDDGNNSNSNFKFNDYLFANDNDTDNVTYRRGVVATVDGSSLSALEPKVTIVAGNASAQLFSKNIYNPTLTNGVYTAAYPTQPNVLPYEPLIGGYFGVRISATPYNLGTLGVSYAQGNVLSNAQLQTISGIPVFQQALHAARRNAYSVDGDFKSGPATLKGVFVASYPINAVDAGLDNADKAGYIKFGVNVSGLQINANYRHIDPAYEDGLAGMSSNDAAFYIGVGGTQSSAPYGANEDGYGGNVSYSFGPIGVGAYVNSFKQAKDATATDYFGLLNNRQTSYGVKAGTSVIRGFSVTGFYNDAKIGDLRVTELFGNDTYENNFDVFGSVAGFKYSNGSNYGINLHHDAKAADALVSGLNIDATYARLYDDNQNVADYKYDDFQVAADYTGKFGMVKIKPFARYHYFNNPNGGAALAKNGSTNYTNGSLVKYEGSTTEQRSYNAYKVGVQVTTDPADVVTKPSLFGNVSYRNTKFDGVTDSSNEFFGSAGLTLNEFVFSGSKLSVGYSYYQGYNTYNRGYYPGVSRYYKPFDNSVDYIFNFNSRNGYSFWAASPDASVSERLQGVYGQWEAWGLRAAYGVYRYNNLSNNTQSTAQAFKVSAKLNF